MTDIVERLRHTYFPDPLTDEAAAEIEWLREQAASLQASSGYEASIAQVEIERLRQIERRLTAALTEETECARQTDDALAKAEADNERLKAIIGYLEDHADIPISVRREAREPKP